MKLQTFEYTKQNGWSVNSFPKLDSDNTLILIFAAPEFINNFTPINELAKCYPKSKIIGCSSAGEISGQRISDNSLSVAVIQFEKTPIRIVKSEITKSSESYAAGEKIAQQLNEDNLRSIFVLSDGMNVNGSELVKGLNTIARENLVITGGLAGDGDRFKNTWEIYQGELVTDCVIAVGFYGDHIKIGHGSYGGWDIFGPERVITNAEKNVLYELDGKPALSLYKDYLGERSGGLPATGLLFPLAIRKSAADDIHLVRTILAVDEKNQSLTFAGDMPTGYLAQLMRGNFDRIISAADEASEQAAKTMMTLGKDNPETILAVAISCVGRRLLLGERTEEETESSLASLPAGTKQIGFYSYGELSPYKMGTCDLHNQTMTLTVFYEN